MNMPPAGAGSVDYVRFKNPRQSIEQRSTVISGLATKVEASIQTLLLKPKTSVTEISTALTQGNVDLKEQLNAPPKLQGNARDRAKSLWRSELMKLLECPDLGAVNSDITPAIPEMAIHIYAKKIGVTDLEYIRSGERFSRRNLSPLGQKHGVEKIRLLVDRPVPNHEDLFKAGLHIVLREILTDPSVVWSDIKDNVSYTFLRLSENPFNVKTLFDAGAHTGLIEFLGDWRATPPAKICAAKALGNLAMEPANRIPLFKANAHIPLMALLSEDAATPLSKECAALTLMLLSADAANLHPLLMAGLHIPLMALLREDAATPLAKEAAAGVLDNLSRDAKNIKPLSDAGLETSLRSLLGDPKATDLAKEYATRALDYLLSNKAGS